MSKKLGSCAVVALLAIALFGGCSKAKSESSVDDVGGEVGRNVGQVVDQLDQTEKSCIEKEPDVAAAAATCVARKDLAKQVILQMENVAPELKGEDAFEACITEAIGDLSDKDIADFAGGDRGVMAQFQNSLSSCSP